MINLIEVKTVVNTGNNKTMMGLLWGYWKGYQKRDGKFYQVTCTNTAYIPDLSVNIFSVTRALNKGFNVKSDKESLVLNKNTTILKFEDRLDHVNGGGYLLTARLYTSPNDSRKTYKEGKSLDGKTTANLEVKTRTKANATIKLKMIVEE